MSDDVLHRAERALRSLRSELEAVYGWTHVDVELALAPERAALIARGLVVAPRVKRRLSAVLTDVLPEAWRLDATGVGLLASGRWRSTAAARTHLWHKLPTRGRALATELTPDDGPVELLAEHAGFSLVRAVDATLGWVEEELGPSVSAPEIAPAHGTPAEVVASARQLLGAPYRLGGTTPEGLDCSGLTQRAFRAGLGVILPRHSTDQLQATLRLHSAPRRHGNLVFAWTAHEGPCHVGILVADESPSIVHASLSRRSVVEDPLERFLEGATRVEIVPLVSVLDYHEQNLGRCCIELPFDEEPYA